MYHAHFGLEKGLFGEGIAADVAVFRSAQHERLASQFKLALGSSSAAIVLRGPAGVGKTTFTSATLRASSTRLALAWLNGTATNASELLELILVELGIAPVRASRVERLQIWRQFHAEMRATDSRLFVVAERTESFPVEVLHALDQLTAPDAAGNAGANLVLLGHQPGIDEHLAVPLLDSLRQRIRLKAVLEPFTEPELQDYLRHQVACAGGHYDHVFAPGTVAALHRFSAGVARLANTLCETALTLAASEKQKLLTAELVTKTAVSLLGLEDRTPAARVPTREAAAAPSAAAPMQHSAPAAPPSLPLEQARVAVPSPATPVTPAAAAAAATAGVTAPRIVPPVAPSTVVPAAGAAAPAPIVFTAAPTVAPTPLVVPTPVPTPNPVAAPTPIAAPIAASTTQPVSAPIPPTPRVTVSTQTASPVPTVESPRSLSVDFDGGATDVTDVDIMDFPVLTDAVDPLESLFVKRPATTPSPAPATSAPPAAAAKPAAAVRPSPPPVAPTTQKPAAATTSRVETAYAAPKAPAASVAAPPKAAPLPSNVDLADDDLLRQTQTMRAIAVAKSIDDISSSMAETLFGDAELDLVAAALASAAADWPDDGDVSLEPVAAEPKPAKTPPPRPQVDDPFDIFDLGDDAPLELIDDSAPPPSGQPRKTAAR